MNQYVTEPARELECVGDYDVVVIGGGIAGVAASVSAARRGAKVALLEKEYGLGGLATLGNIIVYLPICDGRGRQVIGGLGEELLKLSVKDVRSNNPTMALRMVPDCWQEGGNAEQRREHRYDASFNPASFQLEMEALLGREGVTIFYDTRFCSCISNSDRLQYVIVENKSGRLALGAKAFVDATGDADLCAASGERTESLNTNVLCGWHYLSIDGQVKKQTLSKRYDPYMGTNGSEGPFFAGDRGKDVSQHVLGTRQMLAERLQKLRDENPDKTIYPFQLASIASFRASRRLHNKFSLAESDMHKWFDDAVGLTGDWRKKGPVYALPLRAIHADTHCNLFVAGRCISADTSVWDVTRVIPTCAITGEAAGAAAALTSLEYEGNGEALDVSKLQESLKSQGALLNPGLADRID